MYPTIYASIYIYLPFYRSILLSVFLSIKLFIYVCIHLSLYLSIDFLSIFVSIYLSVHLSIYLRTSVAMQICWKGKLPHCTYTRRGRWRTRSRGTAWASPCRCCYSLQRHRAHDWMKPPVGTRARQTNKQTSKQRRDYQRSVPSASKA